MRDGSLKESVGEGTIRYGNSVCYNQKHKCLAVNVVTRIQCVKPDGCKSMEIELPHDCKSKGIAYCPEEDMYVVAEAEKGCVWFVVNENILGSFYQNDKGMSIASKALAGLAVTGGIAAAGAIGVAVVAALPFLPIVAVPVAIGAGITGGAGGMATVTGTVGAVVTRIKFNGGEKQALEKQIPATVQDIKCPTYLYHDSREGQDCCIWVVESESNIVGGYNSKGEATMTFGDGLAGDYPFSSLDSICIDNQGRFVMCDSIGRRVIRCELIGEKEQWDVILSSDQLNNGKPVSAVITPEDQIIIAVTHSHDSDELMCYEYENLDEANLAI